jgi:hypothetical protein
MKYQNKIKIETLNNAKMYHGKITLYLPYKNIYEQEEIKTLKTLGEKHFLKQTLLAYKELNDQFGDDSELLKYITQGSKEGKAMALLSYEGDFDTEVMVWIGTWQSILLEYSNKELVNLAQNKQKFISAINKVGLIKMERG